MLSQRTRLVLNTLLPSGAHPALPFGLDEAGFDEFWAEFERARLPVLRWPIHGALFVAIWIAPLLIGRLPPLTRHDRPTRERALAALGASRSALLRQMLMVLKTTVSFYYGADPRVRDAIGYPLQHDDPRHKAMP